MTHPLFPDPNNGAAFVPESETSLAGSGEWPGFLLVGLKMADKKSDFWWRPSNDVSSLYKQNIEITQFYPRIREHTGSVIGGRVPAHAGQLRTVCILS
jgi:hypothetical protein